MRDDRVELLLYIVYCVWRSRYSAPMEGERWSGQWIQQWAMMQWEDYRAHNCVASLRVDIAGVAC